MGRAVVGIVLAGLALGLVLQLWVMHEQGRPLPVRRDECAGCHRQVEGIEPGHATLSCAACHLGNAFTAEPKLSHVGLVRIPGNAADMARTCGASGCHVDVPQRIGNNIMNTMNGVVSVDRWVFGEQPTPTAITPVQRLGHSPADTHLRNLCASCHLSNPKTEAGPLHERSRGGGCNACHLRYSEEALDSLGKGRDPGVRFVHSALSVKPEPIACFGCHSRSGRVSLNAEGWQEFAGDAGSAELRQLDDGRVVKKGLPDVHTERGLGCVDCHGSWEVMGDGTLPLHREAQSTLRCTDCHRVVDRSRVSPSAPLGVNGDELELHFAELDPESKRIAKLEGFDVPDRRYLAIARSGVALINTFVADGGAFLTGKYTGRTVAMVPPADACTKGTAHDALACATCHEAWVPQCVSCHSRFIADGGMYDLLDNAQAPGDWQEEGGAPLADRASLGVRELDGGARRVEEFAPGMVMTLAAPAGTTFHRLFAPVFAHTIRRESRSCLDCHASSLALGYGRGELRYDSKRWTFSPRFPLRKEDGLPEDAWIGFLQTRGFESTTREDTRPFTVEEQRRVLTVGVCLGCHAPGSAPMQQGLDDFAAVQKRMTPRCKSDRLTP
ncbi:MAG: hypothetical protein Q8L48_20550 [Archangium sp.]|nr:hypothetical protein [Archangium sp.]